MTTIAERVAAGAAFLDEHDPGWWRADVPNAIHLDTLDLGSERSCVLGQRCPLEVLRSYAEREWGDPDEADPDDRYMAYAYELSKATTMNDAVNWGQERGFVLRNLRSLRNADAWLDLTTTWKHVIAERRAAA
jgi:hypothetical protein